MFEQIHLPCTSFVERGRRRSRIFQGITFQWDCCRDLLMLLTNCTHKILINFALLIRLKYSSAWNLPMSQLRETKYPILQIRAISVKIARGTIDLDSSYLIDCIFGATCIALCVKQLKLRRSKFQKIKIYSMLIFERKQVNTFSNGAKLPTFCHEYLVQDFFKASILGGEI